jgi:hypothetical protein
MATLTPQAPGTLTYAAASGGGDTLALGTKTSRPVFLVRNGSGSAITVTLAGINPCSQGVLHSQAVVCAAGADTEIVPLPQVIDQTPATAGNVTVTYSAVTSLTVAVVAS